MPQLVKGGKHVFAWTVVGEDGEITIPPEAIAEYALENRERLFVLPGSRTSGGFSIGLRARILDSPVASAVNRHAQLRQCRVPAGDPIQIGNNVYCWVTVRDGGIVIPPQTLLLYHVAPGDRLLGPSEPAHQAPHPAPWCGT